MRVDLTVFQICRQIIGRRMRRRRPTDPAPPWEGESTDWLGSSLSRSEQGRDWSDRQVRQVHRRGRTEAGGDRDEEQPQQPPVQVGPQFMINTLRPKKNTRDSYNGAKKIRVGR